MDQLLVNPKARYHTYLVVHLVAVAGYFLLGRASKGAGSAALFRKYFLADVLPILFSFAAIVFCYDRYPYYLTMDKVAVHIDFPFTPFRFFVFGSA